MNKSSEFVGTSKSGRQTTLLLFVLCLSFSLTNALIAQTIKVGSLVPKGSPWDRRIHALAADFARITDGKVTLRIYSHGVAGDEPDLIRKMRIDQLQAAGLSVAGLSQIFSDIVVPALPFMVENETELKYLLEKMSPFFNAEFEKRGFKVLFYNFAGWAHFFSRHPIVYPGDLKKQKMWVLEGSAKELNAWKKLGFNAVSLSTMDILVQLQTGGVDAFVSSPLIAAANQWFGIANHMSGLRYAPFFGAFVITRKAWNRIPSQFHSEILEAAKSCAIKMEEDTIRAVEDAVRVMQKYGLKISEYPEDAREKWREFMETAIGLLLEGQFSQESYARAKSLLREHRRKQ
jgi:TRAP-type C4-dicarboxylate transport system substrate-binding protein